MKIVLFASLFFFIGVSAQRQDAFLSFAPPKIDGYCYIPWFPQSRIALDIPYIITGKNAGKDWCSETCHGIGCVAFVHVKGHYKDFYCKLYMMRPNRPLEIEVDKFSGTNDRVWIKVYSPGSTKCVDIDPHDFLTSRRLETNTDGQKYGFRQTGPKNYELYPA
ncbi:unnamed protein product [Caenorhabditis nigoni]